MGWRASCAHDGKNRVLPFPFKNRGTLCSALPNGRRLLPPCKEKEEEENHKTGYLSKSFSAITEPEKSFCENGSGVLCISLSSYADAETGAENKSKSKSPHDGEEEAGLK